MRTRKGLMLLDVIILILAIGVIATLILPYLRTEESLKIRNLCRQRMLLISDAELKYFETAGGQIKPEEKSMDSTDVTDTTKVEKEKKATEEKASFPRVFTKNFEELKKMVPQDKLGDFKSYCPLDGQEYIIMARDSFFFSISCPNGHGQIIMGTSTWSIK
ncbi:hypothetical protein J7L68_03570 [bacterium]|nr:hypothetical protein [bacterium]